MSTESASRVKTDEAKGRSGIRSVITSDSAVTSFTSFANGDDSEQGGGSLFECDDVS